jgi:glycogen(starch) synthase
MRVLAVGSMYPPHHLGGYELVWRSATEDLRARGHPVRIITTDFRSAATAPEEPETFRELRWYWRDHAWPKIGWRERLALERHNGAVLDRHMREFRPDVVAWWAMGGMSLSLIERVRRLGVPAVAFVHDDWVIYGPEVDRWSRPFRRRPRLAVLVERLTGVPAATGFEDAARWVFVSETVRAHARASGPELADSGVAHSGIDHRYLNPRPEREWDWRLLYVGRLDERKGVLDTVAALPELPGTATLTLVGAGERRIEDRVRRLARELDVERRVRLIGMRPREDLPDLYAAADAIVFAVRWEEPWGLVPLEAMALGRPVIATGRGGSGEYLRDGSNCLIVPAGDAEAIAGAARRLARDPPLRARLRAGGLETARLHTDTAFNDAARHELEAVIARSGHVPSHHAP